MDISVNILLMLLLCLTSTIKSQSVITTTTTLTYTTKNTTVDCPIQQTFILPSWDGPPVNKDNSRTIYTANNDYRISSVVSRVVYASNNRSIIVSNTQTSDAGKYVCVKAIENTVYQGENTVIVRVKPQTPDIAYKETLDNYTIVRATEDQPVALTCTSRGGNPAPTVAWYRDSINTKALVNSSSGTPVGDTFTVVLDYTFTPTAGDDGHVYICRVYYPDPLGYEDPQETNVTLYLYLKPSVPIVSQPNGSAAQCMTRGSRPAANVTWIYQSETYNIQGETTIHPDGTFMMVSTFPRLLIATDNGQSIRCVVTHQALVAPASQLSKDVVLDVIFPPQSVTIEGNRNIVANGTNTVTLTCITGSSNPAANITWTHNITTSSTRILADEKGDYDGIVRKSQFTLTPTRHNDGDVISCTASNSVSGNNVTNETIINCNYCPLVEDITIPAVDEGNSINMSCIAWSKPSPIFKWYKGSDSTVLDETGGTYVGKNKAQSSYIIRTVKREHAGIYTCTAQTDSNACGQPASKSGLLTVFYPPDVTVANKTTYRNRSVTMHCNATGYPSTDYKYKWRFSLHALHNSIVAEWNNQSRDLILDKPTYQDSGLYTCIASNGIRVYGTDIEYMEGSGSLLVKSEPLPIIPPPGEAMSIELQLNVLSVIRIKFYSNVDGSYLEYKRHHHPADTGVLMQPAIFKQTPVDLHVFSRSVKTTGTEAIIHITILNNSGYDAYSIHIRNEVGSVAIPLLIKPIVRLWWTIGPVVQMCCCTLHHSGGTTQVMFPSYHVTKGEKDSGLPIGYIVLGVSGGLMSIALIALFFRRYKIVPRKDGVRRHTDNVREAESNYEDLTLERRTKSVMYDSLPKFDRGSQTYENMNI